MNLSLLNRSSAAVQSTTKVPVGARDYNNGMLCWRQHQATISLCSGLTRGNRCPQLQDRWRAVPMPTVGTAGAPDFESRILAVQHQRLAPMRPLFRARSYRLQSTPSAAVQDDSPPAVLD